MKTESDTPLTDAYEDTPFEKRPKNRWDFTRDLERENAALRAENERLRELSELRLRNYFAAEQRAERAEAEIERLMSDRVNYDLLDERNALLADKERLDWLEAGPERHVIGETGCTGAPFFICQDRADVRTAACGAATVREAIDKAIDADRLSA